VKIQVNVKGDNIILIISDNGRGFDMKLPSTGVGMINIQNRAALFNGKVDIISSPGNGCVLKVEMCYKAILQQKVA